MTESDLAKYKEAIRLYTEEMLRQSKQTLRMKLNTSQREIDAGWIGISDWLMEKHND